MRPPIFVRPLTDAEREQVEAGLRSSDAFVLRRCQIVLASARGERAPAIAGHLSEVYSSQSKLYWALLQLVCC